MTKKLNSCSYSFILLFAILLSSIPLGATAKTVITNMNGSYVIWNTDWCHVHPDGRTKTCTGALQVETPVLQGSNRPPMNANCRYNAQRRGSIIVKPGSASFIPKSQWQCP